MPWHVDWFRRVFPRLGPAAREAELGESTIHLFPAAELLDAGTAVLRAEPGLVAPARCPCAWCAARPRPSRDPAAETRS